MAFLPETRLESAVTQAAKALLLETNQAMTEVLGIDFAASAAPAGGGACCG